LAGEDRREHVLGRSPRLFRRKCAVPPQRKASSREASAAARSVLNEIYNGAISIPAYRKTGKFFVANYSASVT